MERSDFNPNRAGDSSDAASLARRRSLTSDRNACYRALVSHDARFDGRFFVGVSSTGVYCRPVCRVRVPRLENCSFHDSAAAAEQAGFRPCLRCRPEQAPGWSTTDISGQLARAAIHLIESRLHLGDSVTDIAARLGVSDRHLRRLFENELGVAPVEYLQTQRLLMAKRLLTDTALSVTDVAGAAGFGSVRRLNASMKSRYQLTPSQLRGRRLSTSAQPGVLQFELSVREPYDFAGMCAFFATRALAGVEHVGLESYARVLSVPASGDEPLHTKMKPGWFCLRGTTQPDRLLLEISPELSAVAAPVIAQVRHLFDLNADPRDYLAVLGDLAHATPGLRVPGAVSGFEIAVRAILGQQVTVKAARTLATRFVERFGQRTQLSGSEADSEIATHLTHAFPEPGRVARARVSSIAELGIISRRAQAIRSLAQAIHGGELDLSPGAPLEQTLTQLNAQAGIGDWTAQYIAMRAMRWPDAFIAADYGVMKALGVKTAAQARAAVQQWRPWRAYAVMHLWASLHQP